MPLASLAVPFDHPDWVHEVKWDGFRALAYVEAATVKLVSRKGSPYKLFRALCTHLARVLPVNDAVIDGEIVYFGPDGRPEFFDLLRHRSPNHFIAFDLLWLNGRDLTRRPLVERKAALQSLCRAGALIRFSEHFDSGVDLFKSVCRMDLEGIVAKRLDGLYTPEETSWVKIKNPAYSQAEGRREAFKNRRVALV